MKTRITTALFALALPLCAQAPVSAETEVLFYKAYYLEKGPREHAQAMELYELFLAKAPEHKLAKEAAKHQFELLDRLGKSKERDAFKEKYAKLLGDTASTRGDRPAAPADAPAEGARGQRGQGGQGAGRPDMAARTAELEKELAKAKEEGDEEAVKRLTAQIERMKQFGAGGQRGQGGQGGQGRGGIMGGKPLAEMNDEELTAFKDGMERMSGMMDRMKQNMTEEQVKKLDESMSSLKKSLDAGKIEDAQKALDSLRESFPQRGRGRGGDAGGQGGGQGGEGGGRRGGGGGNGGGGGGN